MYIKKKILIPGLRILTIHKLNTPQKQIQGEMYFISICMIMPIDLEKVLHKKKTTIIYNRKVAN